MKHRKGTAYEKESLKEEAPGTSEKAQSQNSGYMKRQKDGRNRLNGLRLKILRLRGPRGAQATEQERIETHPRGRILRVLPLEQVFLPKGTPRQRSGTDPDSAGGKELHGKEATEAAESRCVRLPFSDRLIPVYRDESLTLSKALSSAGPGLHNALLPLLQYTFKCCSSSLAVWLSCERAIPHCYIVCHLLQEVGWRIQQQTQVEHDPFAGQGEPTTPYIFPDAAEESADSGEEGRPVKAPLSSRNRNSNGSFLQHTDPRSATATLQEDPCVACLLDCYTGLLLAEKLEASLQKKGPSCHSVNDNQTARWPILLLTTPALSCLRIPPWHLWYPGKLLAPQQPRAFRLSVQLHHVALAECHLFSEEDRLVQRLLNAYEAYAYIARCANGEQLTAKLRSCLHYSKEVRTKCGLPQNLTFLVQAAVAVVSVYLQQQPQQQEAQLLGQLQHLPQLPHRVQHLCSSLSSLKRVHPQVSSSTNV